MRHFCFSFWRIFDKVWIFFVTMLFKSESWRSVVENNHSKAESAGLMFPVYVQSNGFVNANLYFFCITLLSLTVVCVVAIRFWEFNMSASWLKWVGIRCIHLKKWFCHSLSHMWIGTTSDKTISLNWYTFSNPLQLWCRHVKLSKPNGYYAHHGEG